VEVCWVCEQGKGDEPKTGKKRKSKGDTKTRRGKAKNTVESDIEEEEIPICESEDEADALPIIAPPTFDAQDGIIDSSTPRKKRKLVAEVVLSSPSPRKRVKISRRSSSPEV
jgi:Fanconi-associated nuclease 1